MDGQHRLSDELSAGYSESDGSVTLYDARGYSKVRLMKLSSGEMNALLELWANDACRACLVDIPTNGRALCDDCVREEWLKYLQGFGDKR